MVTEEEDWLEATDEEPEDEVLLEGLVIDDVTEDELVVNDVDEVLVELELSA